MPIFTLSGDRTPPLPFDHAVLVATRWDPKLGTRLKQLRQMRGLSQAALASRLTPKAPQSAIQKLESGERELTPSWMRRLSVPLGISLQAFLADEGVPTVPLVGYVGANPAEEIVFEDQGGELGTVEAPPGAHDGMAVEVRGNSMAPRFFDGDRVFYSRTRGLDPRAFLNKDCVVRLRDGRTVLKRVERGSRRGVFSLRSYNPAMETMPDAPVEWIAPVTWVRPR